MKQQMELRREQKLDLVPVDYNKKHLEELITAASVKYMNKRAIQRTAKQYKFLKYASPQKDGSVRVEFLDPIDLNAVTSLIQTGGLEQNLSITDRKDEPFRDVSDSDGNRLFSYSGHSVLFPFTESLAKGQEAYEKAMKHTVDLITKIHSDVLMQNNPDVKLHEYLPFLKEGIENYVADKEFATILAAMYDVSEGKADEKVSKYFIYTRNSKNKEQGKRTWMLKRQSRPVHVSYIISPEDKKEIIVKFDVNLDIGEIEKRIKNQAILKEKLKLSDVQEYTLPKGTFVNGRASKYPITVPYKIVYNAEGNELLRLEGKQMLHLRPRAEYSNREYLQAITLANDIHEQMLFYTGALRDSEHVGLSKPEFDVINMFSKLARCHALFYPKSEIKKRVFSGLPDQSSLEWIQEKMQETNVLEDLSKRIGYVAGEIIKQVNMGRLKQYGPDAAENLARLKLLEKQYSGN